MDYEFLSPCFKAPLSNLHFHKVVYKAGLLECFLWLVKEKTRRYLFEEWVAVKKTIKPKFYSFSEHIAKLDLKSTLSKLGSK